MFWRRRKSPQEIRQPSIRFLGEQDGEPERQLKSALVQVFEAYPGLGRAYLAVVAYGGSDEFQVSLCLSGGEDHALIKAVGNCFAQIFSSAEHLDILFLSAEQESELMAVCKPFYTFDE